MATIDLTGREVPINVSGGMLNGGQIASQKTFGAEFKARPDTDYGLLVGGGGHPIVTINRRILDIDPLHRSDGALFRVPSHYLKPGQANTLAVSREPASTAASLIACWSALDRPAQIILLASTGVVSYLWPVSEMYFCTSCSLDE